MKQTKSGFTLVELVIVIAVIAILATITVVSYSGIQREARDTKRKNDVAQIAKLLATYQIDRGPMWTDSGCGGNGNGNGYFNAQNTTTYPKSIMQCLIDAGLTNTEIKDNSNSCSGANCRTYMKYTCTQDGATVTYVYANLETGTHNGDETDTTCASATTYDSSYGMNYYVRLD